MLPALPKADDYFLLRWLRGEVTGIREAGSKGKERKEQDGRKVRWALQDTHPAETQASCWPALG